MLKAANVQFQGETLETSNPYQWQAAGVSVEIRIREGRPRKEGKCTTFVFRNEHQKPCFSAQRKTSRSFQCKRRSTVVIFAPPKEIKKSSIYKVGWTPAGSIKKILLCPLQKGWHWVYSSAEERLNKSRSRRRHISPEFPTISKKRKNIRGVIRILP